MAFLHKFRFVVVLVGIYTPTPLTHVVIHGELGRVSLTACPATMAIVPGSFYCYFLEAQRLNALVLGSSMFNHCLTFLLLYCFLFSSRSSAHP